MGFSIIDASIIIPCKNENNNLKITIDSIISAKNIRIYEVIIVDDGSDDNSTEFLKLNFKYKDIILIKSEGKGCANAKNKGAEIARGRYYFFIDAHIKVQDYWIDELINTMDNNQVSAAVPGICDIKNPSAIGYGETFDSSLNTKWITKKPDKMAEIPIACGCTFAIRKEVFNKINGFDRFFLTWGREDEEISIKLWLYGYRLVVVPNVCVQHLFRKKFPYKVIPSYTVHNTICMAFSHFNKVRLKKTLEILKYLPEYDIAQKLVQRNFNNIMKQRTSYFNERRYDDDYFFYKFNIMY